MKSAIHLIENCEIDNQALAFQLIAAKIFATVGKEDRGEDVWKILKDREFQVMKSLSLKHYYKKFRENIKNQLDYYNKVVL